MSKARGLADLGNAYSDGALSNRNVILNGSMILAQRGTSATLSSGNFTLDRFKIQSTGLDELVGTMTQDSDVPNGFANSLKITTTTAETSIAADEYFYVAQFIEAQNLQQLSFGNSSAKSITLSFWAKSTQTGNFAVSLYTPDNAGMANSTYTINAASTWEYKTLTFTGDTSRAINNDNGTGMYVNFHLAAGTNFTSDPTDGNFEAYSDAKWAGGHTQNGVITTTNATFQITGVQLEVGDTATPFEHRSYGDELARCKRYFQVFTEGGDTTFGTAVAYAGNAAYDGTQQIFPVEMRASPTRSTSGSWTASDGLGAQLGVTSFYGITTKWGYQLGFGVSSGLTIGRWYNIRALIGSGSQLKFDAEL